MVQFLIAEKDTSFLKTFKFRFKLSKIASFSYTFSVWVFFQRQRRLAEQQGQEEDHPYSLLFSIISSRSWDNYFAFPLFLSCNSKYKKTIKVIENLQKLYRPLRFRVLIVLPYLAKLSYRLYVQYLHCRDITLKKLHLVDNKAKGWLSKREFQENKVCQIFRKTNVSYLLIRTRKW